jgi:hypothetical protein
MRLWVFPPLFLHIISCAIQHNFTHKRYGLLYVTPCGVLGTVGATRH